VAAATGTIGYDDQKTYVSARASIIVSAAASCALGMN